MFSLNRDRVNGEELMGFVEYACELLGNVTYAFLALYLNVLLSSLVG